MFQRSKFRKIMIIIITLQPLDKFFEIKIKSQINWKNKIINQIYSKLWFEKTKNINKKITKKDTSNLIIAFKKNKVPKNAINIINFGILKKNRQIFN